MDLSENVSKLELGDSDSGSVASYISHSVPDRFHGYDAPDDRSETIIGSADCLKSKITVNINDAHDYVGPGMSFDVTYTTKLKNIFDTFRVTSCKNCRPGVDIRFKLDDKKLRDSDSLQSVGR
jgi:hypothetical protein